MADKAKDQRIESDNPTRLDRLPGSKRIDGDVVNVLTPLLHANSFLRRRFTRDLQPLLFCRRATPSAPCGS
jgi:hypothetical protein